MEVPSDTGEVSSGFERRLALTYQQAVRARAEVEQMADLATHARRAIADLRTGLDASGTPMDRLARRLALAPEQVELVWALVACSVDGRLLPHLETLGGGHARRGLSLAVYAMLAELADESVARLAHWLASPNALLADGLIVATEQVSPAARAHVASPRLVSYLRGEPHGIAPLRLAAAPVGLLHDAHQLATIREIAAALTRSANPILVVEGPQGSGRVTACAQAAGAELIVLDLARLAAEDLREALTALRRESLLRTLIPVLANVDQMVGDEQRAERRMIAQLVDDLTGPLIVTSSVAGADLGTQRAMVRIQWDVADLEVRGQLWDRAVAGIDARVDGALTGLAHRYRVGPGAIQRAVASVQLLHPAGTSLERWPNSASASSNRSRPWPSSATSNALQGSMQLAAKQLHGVAGTIEKALTGPGNEGGYDVRLQGIPHQFSMAQDIGRHVMSVAKKSDALLKDPNLVHHRKTDFDDLWGAYSRFESAMNAANKMSAEHNGPLTNLNPDFVKNEMRDLFSVFGGLYDEKATTPNSAEAKGTEADAIKGALLEHVDAAYEAARALHLGEPNGSERFKFHVKETRSLLKAVESTKGGLAPYKDKLKHLVTEVRALEKDRPGMDGVIKDVLPVVDELEKLSK